MLLRNKINYLSDSGDIEKLMEYLGKTKRDVNLYITAYSQFVNKSHTAVAMPLLKEGLKHFPDDQVRIPMMVELCYDVLCCSSTDGAIDLYKNDVKCGKFMLHEI